ncbi:uncharacterized protein [Ciconia boyciana]|uniref:uncharacterized protein isoform X4 n=2 Tax=Ciconia boyciana TaxID=52775 RepID=UPI003BA25DF4
MPGSQKLPCVPSCLSLTARCLALAGSQKGRGTARRSSEHILPHAGRPRSPWNSIAETETPVRVPVRMGRLQVFLCLPSGICLATTKYLPKILHSGFHLPDSAFSLHKSWTVYEKEDNCSAAYWAHPLSRDTAQLETWRNIACWDAVRLTSVVHFDSRFLFGAVEEKPCCVYKMDELTTTVAPPRTCKHEGPNLSQTLHLSHEW